MVIDYSFRHSSGQQNLQIITEDKWTPLMKNMGGLLVHLCVYSFVSLLSDVCVYFPDPLSLFSC